MEILFLALACVLFSAQFVFSKMYQKNTDASLLGGMWFSAITALMAVLCLIPTSGLAFEVNVGAVVTAVIYTAASVVTSVACVIAMSCGSLAVVTTVELVGGMILPFLYGIFLGESITPAKIAGVIVILASPLCSLVFADRSKSEKQSSGGGKFTFAVMCLLIFVGNGMVSVASKMQSIAPDAVSSGDFLILSGIMRFVVSALIIAVIALLSRKKKSGALSCFKADGKTARAIALGVVIASICYTAFNTLGNVFSLECAKTMDASVQFPILSAAVIIITAVLARIIYKEKIPESDFIGLVLAVVGIIIYMF